MAAVNKTALFVNKQAGGVFNVVDMSEHPGNVWFVDSGHSDASDSASYGRNPDLPFATIDYAVGKCTASNGDVIYVAPGHAETVIAAGGIDLDVAGISVIGLGSGALRPTVTFTTSANADVDVDAASITVKNILFVNGIDDQVAMIDVNADDFTIEDCEFRAGSSTQALRFIYLASANVADRCIIKNCKFTSTADGGDSAIDIEDAQDGVRIEGCWIDGDFDDAGIESDAVFTNALIKDNVISNRATGQHAIELSGAATGLLVGNSLYGDTLGTILDPGSMKCLGNYETDAVDQAGVPTPRTSADTSIKNITDALYDSTGIASWSSAAAPANGVSISEVLRDVWDALRNGTGGSEPATNRSIMDYLLASSGFYVPGLGFQVTKNCSLAAANDDLFTVTGKVMVTLITGQVESAALTGAESFQLRLKTSNEPLCAATIIDTDADGTMYLLTGDVGATMNAGDAPTTNVAQAAGTAVTPLIIGQAGGSATIESNTTGNGGTIAFTLYYYPLEASASVAAAA